MADDTPEPVSKRFFGPSETAKILGVSLTMVRKFVETGQLHAQKRPDGRKRFRAIDVARLAERRQREYRSTTEGDLAARAFEMFRAAKSRTDVVIELRVAPRIVEGFWEDFMRFEGRVIPPLKAPLEAPEPTADELRAQREQADAFAAELARRNAARGRR